MDSPVTDLTAPHQLPTLADDPFGDEVLAEPLDFQHRLREAGRVVHLSAYNLLAIGRYHDVRATMVDWQNFQSGAGVGMTDPRSAKPYRPPGLLLEQDPPQHDAPRHITESVLSPPALRRLRESWMQAAEEMVEQLLRRGEVDAVSDFAEAYPLRVFPDALGIPKEGRQHLLPYADSVFTSFGPKNGLAERAIATFDRHLQWMQSQGARESLTDDGFGAQFFAAADRGDITHEQAPMLVRGLLTAGIDTTAHALAALIEGFLSAPDQWQILRAEPSRARVAFDEAVRWASPVQTFFRTATRDVAIADVVVARGDRIMVVLGAANRDPRRWENPDSFDIQRDPSGHIGFGMGIHHCVGQHVSRLEAECVLHVLARRVARIEPAGEPRRRLNNTLRGWASLPIRLVAE
ncbi:cytochrome P450 [Mycobacterium colombiense]|uniref:cytochrome P450 n=1 Tax=Mycobacterium colombiense TaxID=339268 RepID=UPI00200B5D71|nr:cytochrome P450 [Mycobacterium colombiense]MCK8647114.1 cytochrome P450 [Mycobacterium colombiense]